jgi:hypothetical protein
MLKTIASAAGGLALALAAAAYISFISYLIVIGKDERERLSNRKGISRLAGVSAGTRILTILGLMVVAVLLLAQAVQLNVSVLQGLR